MATKLRWDDEKLKKGLVQSAVKNRGQWGFSGELSDMWMENRIRSSLDIDQEEFERLQELGLSYGAAKTKKDKKAVAKWKRAETKHLKVMRDELKKWMKSGKYGRPAPGIEDSTVIDRIDKLLLTEKIKWTHGFRAPTPAQKKKWKADPQMELSYWTKELNDLKRAKSKIRKGNPGASATASSGIGILKDRIDRAKEKIKKQKAK